MTNAERSRAWYWRQKGTAEGRAKLRERARASASTPRGQERRQRNARWRRTIRQRDMRATVRSLIVDAARRIAALAAALAVFAFPAAEVRAQVTTWSERRGSETRYISDVQMVPTHIPQEAWWTCGPSAASMQATYGVGAIVGAWRWTKMSGMPNTAQWWFWAPTVNLTITDGWACADTGRIVVRDLFRDYLEWYMMSDGDPGTTIEEMRRMLRWTYYAAITCTGAAPYEFVAVGSVSAGRAVSLAVHTMDVVREPVPAHGTVAWGASRHWMLFTGFRYSNLGWWEGGRLRLDWTPGQVFVECVHINDPTARSRLYANRQGVVPAPGACIRPRDLVVFNWTAAPDGRPRRRWHIAPYSGAYRGPTALADDRNLDVGVYGDPEDEYAGEPVDSPPGGDVAP